MGAEPNDTPGTADPLGAFGFRNRLDRLQWVEVSGSLNGTTDRIDHYSAPVSATVGQLFLSLDFVSIAGAFPQLNMDVNAIRVSVSVGAFGAFGFGSLQYSFSLGASNIAMATTFEALSLSSRLAAALNNIGGALDYETRTATLEVLGNLDSMQRGLTWPLSTSGPYDITAGLAGNMAVLADLEARLSEVAPSLRDDIETYLDLVTTMTTAFFTPRSAITATQWTGTGDEARAVRIEGDTVTLTASEGIGYVAASGSVVFRGPNGSEDVMISLPVGYTFTIGARSTRDLYDLSGNDAFVGTERDEILHGGQGDDDLSAMGGNDQVFGGTGHDTVAGGRGDDLVRGGDGNDRLRGGAGSDVLRGDRGHDTLTGDADADRCFGGAGHDSVSGGAGDDTLVAGGGNDTILAGSGRDKLVGGGGADLFVWADAAESGTGRWSDQISDFTTGQDRIDLSGLHDGLTFVRAFGNIAGEVRFAEKQARLLVDLDGDGAADFGVQLQTGARLIETDLVF